MSTDLRAVCCYDRTGKIDTFSRSFAKNLPHETRMFFLVHKTDILAVELFGGVQVEFGGHAADLGFGVLAHRENQLGQNPSVDRVEKI